MHFTLSTLFCFLHVHLYISLSCSLTCSLSVFQLCLCVCLCAYVCVVCWANCLLGVLRGRKQWVSKRRLFYGNPVFNLSPNVFSVLSPSFRGKRPGEVTGLLWVQLFSYHLLSNRYGSYNTFWTASSIFSTFVFYTIVCLLFELPLCSFMRLCVYVSQGSDIIELLW